MQTTTTGRRLRALLDPCALTRAGAGLAVFMLAACASSDVGRSVARRLVDGAETLTADGARVHFGPVLIGARAERVVVLHVEGHSDPRTPTGTCLEPADGPFAISVDPGSAAETRITIAFAPSSGPGAAHATATVRFAEAGEAALVLELTGSAIASCGDGGTSTDALVFGNTNVGEFEQRELPLRNPGATPWSVRVADPRPDAFALRRDFASRAHLIPGSAADGAPSELGIPVEFHPTLHGEMSGVLELPVPVGCPTRSAALQGFGISTALSCEPTVLVDGRPVCRVDFGARRPGDVATGFLTFRNRGPVDLDVTIGAITSSPSSVVVGGGSVPFELVDPDPKHAHHTIPAGGTPVDVGIYFQATGASIQRGLVAFTMTDRRWASGSAELVGAVVGPILSVPDYVDLGVVPRDAPTTRDIPVVNAGVGLPGSGAGNLMFAALEDDGWAPRPPEIVGSDEFSLEWPPKGYQSNTGVAPEAGVAIRLTLTPRSYGEKSATLRIYSNDRASEQRQPITEVALHASVALPACDVTLAERVLDFGFVVARGSSTRRATVVNRTTNPDSVCALSGVQVSSGGGAFALVDAPAEPVLMRGGETYSFDVRFVPPRAQEYSDELQIEASGVEPTILKLPLHGFGADIGLQFSPPEVDFGSIDERCASDAQTVIAYNFGAAVVQIDDVAIAPVVSSRAFEVMKRPSLPLRLAPGKEAAFEIRYAGSRVGQDRSALELTVAGWPAPLGLDLRGEVETRPAWTDEFQQHDDVPKFDLLLIVDDSPAMADKLTSLQTNFDAFAQYVFGPGHVDYHIAVTTTSVGGPDAANGRLLPLNAATGTVITPTTPAKPQVFADLVNVGANGEANPELIAPAQLALSEPLLSGHNAGFYRQDATLRVFVVTASADAETTPIADYQAFLEGLKGPLRAYDVSLYAVAPSQPTPPAGCSYATPNAGNSSRVRDLVFAMGGYVTDICAPDWWTTLTEPHCYDCYALETHFQLSHWADPAWQPDALAVEIDGLPIPQYNPRGSRRWGYDPVANALEFDPLSAPDPGSVIRVSYHLGCY